MSAEDHALGEPWAARVGPYRGYGALVRAWKQLVEHGARVLEIGRSVEGRSIFRFEIGAPEAREIAVVIAGLHAIEWIGVETATELARLLVHRARGAPNLRVLVFPLVNVDGHARVEEDLRAGRRRARRGNAHGVDLNRNFPTFYRHRSLASTLLPMFDPGASALSEPETAAIVRSVEAEAARGARIVRALSLHSFGRRVLYPYAARWTPPAEVELLREAAATLAWRCATPYRIHACSRWAPGLFAHGTELDHFYMAYGATSLLVECSAGGARAGAPASLFDPFRWYNPADPARAAREVAPALAEFVIGEGRAMVGAEGERGTRGRGGGAKMAGG